MQNKLDDLILQEDEIHDYGDIIPSIDDEDWEEMKKSNPDLD